MSRLRVDLQRLDRLIGQLHLVQRELGEMRAQVDARARELRGSWTGQAAAAQEAAHGRWTAGAAEVHEALVALRAMAATAHENYASAAQANRRMWAL